MSMENIMTPQLAVHPNWELMQGADYPVPTFMRKGRAGHNVFQISAAMQLEEKELSTSADLETLAVKWVESLDGKAVGQSKGRCEFGEFASAVFTAQDLPYCQLWCISNNVHLIFVTFICEVAPTPDELKEVETMALSLTLPDRAEDSRSVH
jgi:hypothetical protein